MQGLENIISVLYVLVAITATVIGLIYGIFALIPVAPFVTQNLSLGIILIVMSVTGIMALVSVLVVILIIGPFVCCCDRQESNAQMAHGVNT
jgi:ABC-type phosphate transport system permease subunit